MGFPIDSTVMIEAACCPDIKSIQFFHKITNGKYKNKTALCGFAAKEGMIDNLKFLQKNGYAMGNRVLLQSVECCTYNFNHCSKVLV